MLKRLSMTVLGLACLAAEARAGDLFFYDKTEHSSRYTSIPLCGGLDSPRVVLSFDLKISATNTTLIQQQASQLIQSILWSGYSGCPDQQLPPSVRVETKHLGTTVTSAKYTISRAVPSDPIYLTGATLENHSKGSEPATLKGLERFAYLLESGRYGGSLERKRAAYEKALSDDPTAEGSEIDRTVRRKLGLDFDAGEPRAAKDSDETLLAEINRRGLITELEMMVDRVNAGQPVKSSKLSDDLDNAKLLWSARSRLARVHWLIVELEKKGAQFTPQGMTRGTRATPTPHVVQYAIHKLLTEAAERGNGAMNSVLPTTAIRGVCDADWCTFGNTVKYRWHVADTPNCREHHSNSWTCSFGVRFVVRIVDGIANFGRIGGAPPAGDVPEQLVLSLLGRLSQFPAQMDLRHENGQWSSVSGVIKGEGGREIRW